jgi:hypothetical protein
MALAEAFEPCVNLFYRPQTRIVLLGVRHLVRKYTLQRRQPTVRLLDLYEPSLTVGHTSYAVGNAYLRNAAELVGKSAKCAHAQKYRFSQKYRSMIASLGAGPTSAVTGNAIGLVPTSVMPKGYYKIFCISRVASNFVVCMMAAQTVK